MALGLFKKWFGGDSRDPGKKDAEQEEPRTPEADEPTTPEENDGVPRPERAPTPEPEERVYDVTPDTEADSGRSLHVGPPRSPSPYATSRTNTSRDLGTDEAGTGKKRSQTFRVQDLPPRQGPTVKGEAPDSAAADKQRSQTFRVQDLPPRQGATAKPKAADSAATDKQRSQTFRVQDLPPRQGPTVKSGTPDSAATDLKRSQTFRVQDLPDRPAAAPKASPAGSTSGNKQRSQTFRVSPPPGAQDTSPTPTEPAPTPSEPPAPTEECIEIPFAALSASLPEPLRGPAFDAGKVDQMVLALPKAKLMGQLREGRVAMNLAELSEQVPPNWLAETAAQVLLDLPTIVAAIPPELLVPTADMVEDADAAADLGSFFLPRQAVPEVPGSAEAPAPVAETPAPAPAAPVEEPTAPGQAEPPAPEPTAAPAQGETLRLPASDVLAQLPASLHGPAWSDSPDLPELSFALIPVVEQLATGRVLVPADELARQLPAGFLTDTADPVELPLAVVVASVPPEALSVRGEEDSDVRAAAKLGSFFVPRGNVPTVPTDEPPATPEPTVAPEPQDEAPAIPEPPTPAAPELPALAAGHIGLPLVDVLSAVPAEARGPAWQDESPDGVLVLDQSELVTQLRTGQVTVPLAVFAAALPDGWLAADETATVELPLPAVVAAVPPEALAITGEVVMGVTESGDIPDIFGSHLAVPEVPAEPEPKPVPKPEPVAEPEPVVEAEPEPVVEAEPEPQPEPIVEAEPVVETEPEPQPEPERATVSAKVETERSWDGVEVSLERAPRGVNINAANLDELATLPGVGTTRAAAIIAHRETHGRFQSIYDLANVPGVGPSLFRKMTGLSLGARSSRHERLTDLLDLPTDRRPFLARLATALMEQVGAVGCVLTDRQGLSLAKVGEMAAAGDRYAALGSRYFLKTKRHLQQFVGQDADCLIVPGCKPPLLLLCADNVVTVLALRSSHVRAKRLSQARKAMGEVAWLLGCRAVVLTY
jgi:competence ComEA-like helix-hairpin-helix protein